MPKPGRDAIQIAIYGAGAIGGYLGAGLAGAGNDVTLIALGPHKTSMLQDLEKGRAMEIDALVTAVQEMSRLVDIETPYIDTVLGLIQQRGRMLGLYPTFAGPDLSTGAGEDERHLVD